MKKSFVFLSVCCLSAVLWGAVTEQVKFDATPEGKARYFAQPHRHWGRTGYPVKPGNRGEIIVLGNNRIKYVFLLYGKETADKKWYPFVGLFRPSAANWCSTGFLDFRIGKTQMKKFSISVKNAVNGRFTIAFEAPGQKAECHFEVRDNDDRLYMVFDSPEQKTIYLSTYPSSYGGSDSGGRHLRKRYAVTPQRRIPFNTKFKWVTLTDKEHYVFFGDSYFDPARKRGEGPCGLIYNPKKNRARVLISNYPCIISISGKGKIPVVLFDFNKLTNAQGEQRMKELPVSFE